MHVGDIHTTLSGHVSTSLMHKEDLIYFGGWQLPLDISCIAGFYKLYIVSYPLCGPVDHIDCVTMAISSDSSDHTSNGMSLDIKLYSY
jgi:hypothetical protein